jgi:uncharacterized protein (DUF1501 family)
MANINKLSRRDFLTHALRGGAALGLTALTQVPPFAQRAMAEGSIGLNGKKLLFIFLRGANDALNSAIPVLDPAYNTTIRPTVYVPSDAGIDYSTTGPADFPTGLASTFEYATAIKLGNGPSRRISQTVAVPFQLTSVLGNRHPRHHIP